MKFEFVEERQHYLAKIRVIGIGGAGGNAINNMIAAKLRGVEFITANTDSQALERSACSNRIQLGASLTRGLGTGGDPERGAAAAEESINDVRESVSGCDMVFLTAGMGGGTGTGAAPVIAKECKESNALTVAVVTKPFEFEGEKRMRKALEGIAQLKKEVDTVIIIPNERLKNMGNNGTSLKELFSRADDVLLNAVRGISDLILSNGFINLDFADVKKVMEQMGTAIMGTGRASGEKRALEAAQTAINSPLLEDVSIRGARGLLMYFTGPQTMTMEEVYEAANHIKGQIDGEAEVFFGVAFDDNLGEDVQITVIATGIDKVMEKEGYGKVVKLREVTPDEAMDPWTVRGPNGENLEAIPAYQRRSAAKETYASLKREEPIHAGKKGGILRGFFKDNLEVPAFMRLKAD